MNFAYFFAKRITFKQQRSISGLVVKLAIFSIAIAIAVMEISLSFVQAFEEKIQEKVIGFGSHIQIGNYFSMDEEEIPITVDSLFIRQVDSLPAVKSIAPYVKQESFLYGDKSMEGVVLKGVDSTFDWSFFSSTLIEGNVLNLRTKKASRGILISKYQAKRLRLKVGDKAKLFFFRSPPRRRPVVIQGIYQTGMEEFDEFMVICDMRMLQSIRRWEPDQISGFEINLHSLNELEAAADTINLMSINYAVIPITRLFPEIFDWLSLQHQNVLFILILMIIVAVINMISVVMILIIERTRDIGILKALGLSSGRVGNIFIWNAFFLILIGVVVGNLLGLGLLFSQDQLNWLKVPQDVYFVKEVPVAWVWERFFWVNVASILVCTIFMLVPTLIISRITPVKAIRFA